MENKVTESPQKFEKLEPAVQEDEDNYILKSDKWTILPVLEKLYAGIQKYEPENKTIFDYVTLTQITLFLEKSKTDCALEFPSSLHGFSRERLHRIAEKYKLMHCSVGKAKNRKMRFARNLQVDYEEEGIKAQIEEEVKKLEEHLSAEQVQLVENALEKKSKIKETKKQEDAKENVEQHQEQKSEHTSEQTRKIPILKVDSKGHVSQVFRHSASKPSEEPTLQELKESKEFQDVPDPVEDYTLVEITPTVARIKWKAPSCNNSQITQYSIYLDNELFNVTKKLEIELPDLRGDTHYTFHVVAENLVGQGYCTEKKFKFMTLPQILTCLKLNEKNQHANQLKLYVWGSDRGLALGLQEEDRESSNYNKTEKCITKPHRVSAFGETDVIGVDGGCKSSVVLDAQNQIIQFGETLYSLLRLKKVTDQADFNIVEIPQASGRASCKIRKVVTGQKFFMALSVRGEVFTWGANSYSTLGFEGQVQQGVPFSGIMQPRNICDNGDLKGQFIVDISCSYISCLVLTDEGKVVGWGTEALLIKEGFQVPSILTVVKPTFLNFIGEKVSRISSGRFHHAMVSQAGECHTFGSNNYLQLGYETEKPTDLYARKVPGIRDGGWKCVDSVCGLDFTIALMKKDQETYSDTKLVAWGRNKKGQCGVGEELVKNRISPHQCLFKKSVEEVLDLAPRVKKIVAGEKHTLILDEDHNVWSCGNSKKGQVGKGVAGSIIVPCFTKIEGIGEEGDIVKDIGAGEQHCLAIVEGKRI